MTWKADNTLTKVAQETFPHHAPKVLRLGGQQLVILGTPYGRVELIRITQGYLLAAERPPVPPGAAPPGLPESLAGHMEEHRLHCWKVVSDREPDQIIRELANLDGAVVVSQGQPWSPFAVTLTPARRLVGAARLECCDRVAALLEARSPQGPPALVIGPAGMGKRTLAAELAARGGWQGAELPLGRVLGVGRVFQTPLELFLDTVVAAGESLGADHLLVISECEVLTQVDAPAYATVLRELARLPRVLLLGDAAAAGLPGVAVSELPGLTSAEEAAALVKQEYPDLTLQGPALALALQAARLGGWAIVPGRLLYLLRLAQRLAGSGGADADMAALTPDDLAAAAGLARPAWIGWTVASEES